MTKARHASQGALIAVLAAGLLAAGSHDLRAQEPLSAIDWLSNTVETPATALSPAPGPDEPPVTRSAVVPEITVAPLDTPQAQAAGLLPSEATGLPVTLWSASANTRVTALIAQQQEPPVPALRTLLRTVLLAEALPPEGTLRDAFLLARADRLLEMGLIEEADALLRAEDGVSPPQFRRLFDIALLRGTEDAACETLRTQPDIAPTFTARIFCLARNGDWTAAALTLETAEALALISPEEDSLFARFLDEGLNEDAGALPVPARTTPLVFRVREAIGEALPTGPLPRAFAHADLRSTVGWKAQLDAAERLARADAIDDRRFQAVYTSRMPAASGGVWDRVEAFQRFKTALEARDPRAVARRLPPVWEAMRAAGAAPVFARLYGSELATLPLDGAARALTFEIGLLTDGYERAAAFAPEDSRARFLSGLALGAPDPDLADTARAEAIAAGFSALDTRPEDAALLEAGRVGEAILTAVRLFEAGTTGDPADLTDALRLLRALGLEETARRASLELLILDGDAT